VSCGTTSSSFTPAAHQRLGLAQHFVDRARHQVAAHRGMMQKLQRWLQPSEIFR
jgi:hypothetical protein